MVHPAEGGVGIGPTDAGPAAEAFWGGCSGAPYVVSSQNDITSEARLDQIVAVLEEQRVERQRKMFEDMIVFEGGAVSDHPSLGTSLIMRDFVHFALYHSKWGYYPKLFRKYRQLMTTGYFDPIPFASLRNQYDYERYATKLHESTPGFVTPTQLFQPYYGWVLAEYLVTTHRAKFDPREPLIVYDIGAGTGALALSMLDYLAEHFPDLYATCEYHAVEQNPHLIQVLRNRLIHHYHHVNIHHLSVLNWRQLEKRRCVVLAVELFSGMPHDCVLWDQEAVVSEHWFGFQQHDNLATAHERYYALQDPIILRYLRYLNWMQEESFHNLKVLCLTDGRETLDAPKRRSIEPNMTDSTTAIFTKMAYIMSPFHTAWLPTVQMVFLETLAQYFPRHHLFVADWSSVRQALPGVNGPVLQVKLRVAKDIYLRRPADALHTNAGVVDICFPTDFDHLSTVYTRICGAHKEVESMQHPVFWQTHGGDKTALFTTRSGYNPLLEDFQPFHVFTSHHSPEL
ncbi:putative S-adenosyl-L-methionine-dependent methyltransferase [Leishmania utingensis]|uniref:Protein arginine methyltransferase NDUFAF7 n=1 Tax=Leishmania utingensis TaxID=653362 RepID=A0AAW3AGK2_9TRYP